MFSQTSSHHIDKNVAPSVHPSLIKAARHSGQLNLSGKSLTEVPEAVWNINIDIPLDSKLLSLDNQDDRWWEQVDLTKLILASNAISRLGDGLANLPALTVLDVHDNQLEHLPDALQKLSNLQRLDVSRNQLMELPVCLDKLTSLVSLLAGHNQLTSLHGNLAMCSNVEKLDISHNKLSELPSAIGLLSRLSHLNVGHNYLHFLPNSIGSLESLIFFDATYNCLTCIPDEFGNLSGLEQLYLHHNKLSHLPSLHNCSNIKELCLGENAIKVITGDHLPLLTSLVHLDVSGNKLVKLPEEIVSLRHLERLDVSNNDIQELPYILGTLLSLRSIRLDGNPMKAIRRDIVMRGTTELKRYLCSRIEEPVSTVQSNKGFSNVATSSCSMNADYMHKIQHLKTLEYSDQASENIPIDVLNSAMDAGVTSANLSRNRFTQLPDKLLPLRDSLQELNMGFNKLPQLSSDIGLYTHIVFLDFRNNELSSIPDEIVSLHGLREFVLCHNRFQEIPACVYNLKNLEILFANDNQVTAIEVSGFLKLSLLCTLDLQNNSITHVPPELGNCTSLRNLQLGGNPCRALRPNILAKGTAAILDYLRSRIVA